MGTSAFRKAVTVGVLVGVATTSVGCKSLLKKKLGIEEDSGAPATKAAASTSASDRADEQLQDKLDEYIKCLNSLSSTIHQSRARYLKYIPRTGPTGRESMADLYRIPAGATAKCTAGVAKGKAMPPDDAKLESAGTDFAAAAAEIDALINEMDTYYELRLFRSDKWAKGKAMHPRLMAGFTHFSKADKELHDTLDGITKPLAQRVLARLEREDGKRFRYWRRKVLITARELVEASDPIGDDDDVDPNRYTAAYTELEKALEELVAYGAANKADLGKQSSPAWPLAESNFDSFVKEAGDFKNAAKEYWRCLQEAPPKARTPSGKIDLDKLSTCGGVAAWKKGDEVIKQFNEFIRTSNSHQFP